MKKFILIVPLLFFLLKIYAQDTINLTNNRQIVAKVLEINDREVKYKIFDFQEGPVYILKRREIVSIKYPNGYTEVITPLASPAPALKPVDETPYSPFLYGAGLNIGIFYPKEVYDFIESAASQKNWHTGSTLDYVNFGMRGFAAYRVNRNFDIGFAAEIATSSKVIFEPNTSYVFGKSYEINKYSAGFVANKQIPIIRKLGINILAALMYHNIEVTSGGESLFSAGNAGIKVQGGVNFHAGRRFTLQGLIGAEYANALDEGMNLNYSGAVFTLNAIFQ